MEVFEFAMQMEKDGQAFYEKMAAEAKNNLIKKILLDLAGDEVKHYNIFKKFRDGDFSGAEDMKASSTKVLESAKNVFQQLATDKPDLTFPSDVRAAWEQAQQVEKKSEDFYREKANEIDKDEVKGTLFLIADEEHKHWMLIENVLEFLDRPKQWLEDAEWNNLDNY
jgi:rubrerythrin